MAKCFLSSLHTSTLYSFCKRSTFYYTLHDFFTLCLSVNFSLKFTSQNWISKSRGVRYRFSRNYQIKLSILRQWFFDVDWVIVCFGACVKLNKANLFYTFFFSGLFTSFLIPETSLCLSQFLIKLFQKNILPSPKAIGSVSLLHWSLIIKTAELIWLIFW